MSAAKLKVSLTLSADLLALVDRDARRQKGSRSSVVEQWLRRAAGARVAEDIESATVAYYESLRADAVVEDEALAKALSGASRRVAYDPPARRRRPVR